MSKIIAFKKLTKLHEDLESLQNLRDDLTSPYFEDVKVIFDVSTRSHRKDYKGERIGFKRDFVLKMIDFEVEEINNTIETLMEGLK